jgi:hypothetical protein
VSRLGFVVALGVLAAVAWPATAPAATSAPVLPAGGAGGAGLSPGLPATPTTTTTPTPTVAPTATSVPDSGLSGGGVVAISIGALAVLGAIAFYIARDARRRAPVRHRAAAAEGIGGRSGSKAPPKPRKLSRAEKRRRKRGRAKR